MPYKILGKVVCSAIEEISLLCIVSGEHVLSLQGVVSICKRKVVTNDLLLDLVNRDLAANGLVQAEAISVEV